jgi:spore maturation protein CgeE
MQFIENDGEIIMIDRIIATEIEYSKCFSEYEENKGYIRFYDEQMMDMYSHNYILLTKQMEDYRFCEFIESELNLCENSEKKHLQIDFHFEVAMNLLEKLKYKPSLISFEYYSVLAEEYKILNKHEEYQITRFMGGGEENKSLNLDLQLNASILGKEFTKRRFERRKEVYKKANRVRHYDCEKENLYIGQADYFQYGECVKIEDFAVLKSFQRKGAGTFILGQLMKEAYLNKKKYCYVLTFKKDSVHNMYKKCGFKYSGARFSLFFDLNN